MYISNLYMAIYLCIILLIAVFFISMMRGRHLALIHKIYFAAAASLVVWLLAMMGFRYTSPDQTGALMLLDAVTTTCGALIPPFSLLFAICYTKEDNYLPKRFWLLLAMPALTMLMVGEIPDVHGSPEMCVCCVVTF